MASRATIVGLAVAGLGAVAVVAYFIMRGWPPSGCTQDQTRNVTYCPDGTTWHTRERCINSIWTPETQECPGGGELTVSVHPQTISHQQRLYWSVSGCTSGSPVHMAVEWSGAGLDFGPDLNCPVTDASFEVGNNIPSGSCTLKVTDVATGRTGSASFTVT